jgi:adenylate cyclase
MPSLRRARTAASTAGGLFGEYTAPGISSLSGKTLWRAGGFVLAIVIVVTNLAGMVAVLAASLFVIPWPPIGSTGDLKLVCAIAAFIYTGAAVPIGTFLGARSLLRLRVWMFEGRPATEAEQRLVLNAPLRLALMQLSLWVVAAAVFFVIVLTYTAKIALWVAITVLITGVTTAACTYLLSERIIRPVAARALSDATPQRLKGRGVATRALLAWACGSGLPVLGLGVIGLFALVGQTKSPTQLGLAIVVLAGIAVAVGLLAVGLAARATADPIDSVRRALGRVQSGDFEVRVPVYDGTQVGQLQLGFNQMVSGLAERERIRETFGTYVDPEVAEVVLRGGESLSGENVEITLMFLDVRNFTGFAEAHPPAAVLAAINELFALIVPIIHQNGGRVDKFIGDGLLAVFGAPRHRPDHADLALAAATEIAAALATRAKPELSIGIGINSGTVMAGNVGAPGRLEFSVIGDAVNVAARVEAATRQTGDTILISASTKALLRSDKVPLAARADIALKGKAGTVELYAPSR